MSNIEKFFLIILVLFFCFFLLHPINLASSDLGRHLINGKEIWSGNTEVLFSNYFSSAVSDNKFVNHHWLSGLIFFLIYEMAGIEILHFSHSLILVASLLIFFSLLRKLSGSKIAFLALIPVIFLFSGRVEIRPECFGYLFMAISLSIYHQYLSFERLTKWQFITLILMQILWVNLHISFIYGIIFVVVLIVSKTIEKKIFQKMFQNKKISDDEKKIFKILTFLLLSITLASILNPNFINGLIMPLSIFSNYGYRVLENQNLLFLVSRIQNPLIMLYGFFAMISISFLALQKIFQFQIKIFWILLSFLGIILGFVALRNMVIFTLFSFPFLTIFTSKVIKKMMNSWKLEDFSKKYWISFSIFLIGIMVFSISGTYDHRFSLSKMKIGLIDDRKDNIQEIKSLLINEVEGKKIFNNYDVGSYLIYLIHPNAKVYVDNRPEAYGQVFFDKYISVMENEFEWQKFAEEQDINIIFFGYHDITPWAQTFISRRLDDNNWRQIYLDDQIIILIKS